MKNYIDIYDELGNEKVNVNLNGKKVITTMGSIVGLRLPLGFAVHIPRIRRKKEIAIENKNRHI